MDMTFLDELGRTIGDKSREAAQKAKEMTELLQVKAQMSSERAKLRDFYATMGKGYYEQHSEDAKEEFSELCPAIQKSLDTILSLEEKVRKLEKTKTCTVCGAVLNRSAAFCSACGAPVTERKQKMEAIEQVETATEDLQEEE